MPYSKSKERENAVARLDELQRCYAYVKMRPKMLPPRIRDSVYYNCVFQVVAVLEDYLLSRLSDWAYLLFSARSTYDAFPVRTRLYLAAGALVSPFRTHVSTDDDKRLVTNLEMFLEMFKIPQGNVPIASEDDFVALVKKRKFPSSRNFEHLFESIGLVEINKKLSKRIKRTNFRLALESLVNVRNAIAHENPPSVTDVDVKRYISDMRKWLGAIDREIYSHIAKTSGPQFWP